MKRSEFIKMCGILGIGIPLQSSLTSCSKSSDIDENNVEKVIIIGAGASGLTAGYLLQQRGIEFEILEASSVFGGRMKRATDFADFPIPLGAEWLHTNRSFLDEIVNDSSVAINVETTPYDPSTDYALYEGEEVSVSDVGFTTDLKFINSTWFDFYEEYVVPSISEKIRYNEIVESIDYSSNQVIIQTTNGQHIADKVIVTVPVKLLQNNSIDFIPELPSDKKSAIANVSVWDGCKAFIEFSEKFYPAFVGFDIEPESAGQKLYYDASYGQSTSQNILGLFAVGSGTIPYVQLSNENLITYILNELDDIFDGQASNSYVKHIFQNWNEEPFANGAYVYDDEDWQRVRTLGESVSNKVFFAGDAYTDGSNWSSVNAAARSAQLTVEEIIG